MEKFTNPYDLYYDDEDVEMPGFIFQGNGYYDEEGIWHDPDVEEEEE